MKLTLRSIGGFAGPAGATVRRLDLASLTALDRAEIQRLIDAARPFEHPPKTMLTAPQSHDFRYQLHVEDGARTADLEFHLAALDAPMRALVDWLEAHLTAGR